MPEPGTLDFGRALGPDPGSEPGTGDALAAYAAAVADGPRTPAGQSLFRRITGAGLGDNLAGTAARTDGGAPARVAADIGKGLVEAPIRGIAGGIRDGLQAVLDLTDQAADWVETTAGSLGSPQIFNEAGELDPKLSVPARPEDTGITLPEVNKPTTVTGGLVRGISQFLAGYATGGKLLKGVRTATAGGQMALAAVKGAISDFAFFDGQDAKLADLIEAHPDLANPVTAFLATDEDDGQLAGRLKRTVEGLGAGVLADGFVRGLRALRAAKKAKAALTVAADAAPAPGASVDDVARALGDPASDAFVVHHVLDNPAPKTPARARALPAHLQSMPPTFHTVDLDGSGQLSKLGTTELGDIAARHGVPAAPRKPAKFDFVLDVIDDQAKDRIWGLDKATKASVIRDRMRKLIDQGYIVEALPDDLRVAKFQGGEWVAAGLGEQPGLKAVDELIVAQFDRFGKTTLSVDDFNKMFVAERRKLIDEATTAIAGDRQPRTPALAKAAEMAKAVNETATGVPDDFAAKGLTRVVQDGTDDLYVNFARIDSPDDVKSVLAQMADALQPQIDKAARGVRTHAQTTVAAERIDAFETLMARRAGEALNAEQSLAARTLWVASGDKLKTVAELAAREPSEANLFAFRKMMAVHHAIQTEVLAARREVARALNSWKIPAGGGDVERLRAITDSLDLAGGPEVSRRMAQRIAALAAHPEFAREFDTIVEKGAAAKTWDAFMHVWINGLLSGPKTHMVNTMSNTSVAVQQVYERGLAARYARLMGDDASVAIGEASAQMFGMAQGIRDGFRYAWKTLRTGETGRYAPAGDGGAGKLDFGRVPGISTTALGMRTDTWAGRAVDFVGNATAVPGRFLQAEDEFFKTVGYRMELHAQAVRQASHEAATGAIEAGGFKARIADLVANPTEAIRLEAVDAALYQTFTRKPGDFTKRLLQVTHEFPVLRMIVPFINTPANIAKYTLERTPVAPLMRAFRADIAAGGARADLAMTRMATGTALLLAASDLASQGHITGGGPQNPAERAALYRTGWQPYSVQVGDRFFAFGRLDPIGSTLGLAGDYTEYLMNADLDDLSQEEMQELTVAMAASFAQNLMSKTYLRGISEFFEVMSDPDRYGERYVNRLVASGVPTLAAEGARFIDPTMRATHDWLSSVKARVPGLGADLPPRRDLWGRPISFQSGLGGVYDAVSPIYSRKLDAEPVDAELIAHGYFPGPAQRTVTLDGVRVSLKNRPDIHSRYVELAGNAWKNPDKDGLGLKDYLNAVVGGRHADGEVYAKATAGPDGGKVEFMRKAIRDWRRGARAALLEEFAPFFEAERLRGQVRARTVPPHAGLLGLQEE